MANYQHILWDWNGTLLNDVWLCVDIINSLLAKGGRPGITHERYLEIFDFPVKGYYARAGFDFTTESFDTICTEYCDEYAARVDECDLQNDALNALKHCVDNDISQSILSTTEQGRLERMADMFGVSHFFDRIIGQTDHYAIGKIKRGKKLLSDLDLDRNKVLLIGDTTHDVQAAREICVDCVLVAIGHHPRAKLKQTGVQVIESLSDIVYLLNGVKNT